MIWQSLDDPSELGFWIDIVHLGRLDESVSDGGCLPAVRAGQPDAYNYVIFAPTRHKLRKAIKLMYAVLVLCQADQGRGFSDPPWLLLAIMPSNVLSEMQILL